MGCRKPFARAFAQALIVALCAAPWWVTRAQTIASETPATPTPTAPPGEADGPAQSTAARYGFDVVAPAELQGLIRERTLLGRWRFRADYDPDQFDSLFARLPDEVRGLARQQGYFAAKVLIAGDASGVRIEVVTGERASVRALNLELRGELSGDPAAAMAWQSRWMLAVGEPFLPERWEQAKRSLLEALQSGGYLRARVIDSEAAIDPQAAAADLRVVIDSGSLLRFGALRIGGLERYDRRLVENLSTFREGEPYSFEALVRLQTRLTAVGYFSSATVSPDLEAVARDPALGAVPVVVEVREMQSLRLALGAGFSTDHGPRAQIGLDQRNLFGTGWQAESVLLVEASRQRLFANARSPISAQARYLGLGSSLDRQDIAGERVIRTSTYGGIGQRRVDGDGFLALTHQFENRRLEAGGGAPVDRDNRVAVVLGYTHTLNRVDSPTDPQKGYSLSGQVSGASQSLGSNRSFVRVYGRARHFWPLDDDGVLAGGTVVSLAEVGLVGAGSRNDIPSENLFRTGGAQSLRGYRYLSLGVPEAGAVTGGRYLVLGSLEYQHRLTASLRAALFYDRGNATDSLSGFTTYAGYGAGARWKTPVGPVLVDLAWGEDSRRPRLHLAVGYGF
jgi:translocation and assembly module TamA